MVKKHKRRLLMIGEPRDAFFVSELILHKGDNALDSVFNKVNKKIHNKKLRKLLLKGYEKNRFEKNFDWIEGKLGKLTGKEVPNQSAVRRYIRIQKKMGKKRALLDRSLKDIDRILD